jgi:hypothetical protein
MSGFVALLPIRFGDEILEPGDEVPVERGRNYPQMMRLGQIAVVRESKPASSGSRSRSKAASSDE